LPLYKLFKDPVL
jgi:hypothetical protein